MGDLMREHARHLIFVFKLLEQVEKLEGERMEIVKKRLQKQLEESGQKEKVNRDRFEQELIYYLEKLDITEEQVRLKSHGELFIETLNKEPSKATQRRNGMMSKGVSKLLQ